MFNLSVDSIVKDIQEKVSKLNKISEAHVRSASRYEEMAAEFVTEANVSRAEAKRASKLAKNFSELING